MSPRSKFIKVRVAPTEYAAIARRADEAGATMSEYVRNEVLAVHETLAIRDAPIIGRVRAQLGQPCRAGWPKQCNRLTRWTR